MINTNLTAIRWKKNLYYISEGVIFDIRNKVRPDDKDECGSFLIDFSKADEVSKNAAIGATVNLTNQTELFSGLPWIEVQFSNPDLNIAVPLQYLIEEGDVFVDDNVGQSHPNVYNKDYRNKFNQEIFEYIGEYVNSKNSLNTADFNQLMSTLPAWLTCDAGTEMTESFVLNNFLKGKPWDANTAMLGTDAVVSLVGVTLKTPAGNANISDSWTEATIRKAALAFYAAKSMSTLCIPADMKEDIANSIIAKGEIVNAEDNKLTALHHIDYTGEGSVSGSEFVDKATNADTWWEYEGADTAPKWEEQGRETITECVQEDGENTGMAVKTTTITYIDTNKYSETYNQTRTETETETVEDLISCPLPEHDTTPNWEEQGRETTTECVQKDGENTGMAVKTTTITYLDTNKYSETHDQTKTETETETVEDLISCPLPEPEPIIPEDYVVPESADQIPTENTESVDMALTGDDVVNSFNSGAVFNNLIVADANVSSNISLNAVDTVKVNGIEVSGTKGAGNGKIMISAPNVNIKDVDINPGCTVYNVFEGDQKLTGNGLTVFVADGITVDDPDLKHNVFNIYNPENNAEITVKNSSFNLNMKTSNVMRLSNLKNAENVTVIFENVDWTYENAPYADGDKEWAGLVIYQPFGNDAAHSGDDSAINTWTFKFKNCRYNGMNVDANEFGEAHQVIYFYDMGGRGASENPVGPTILFD